jgi:hypothetical protein
MVVNITKKYINIATQTIKIVVILGFFSFLGSDNIFILVVFH